MAFSEETTVSGERTEDEEPSFNPMDLLYQDNANGLLDENLEGKRWLAVQLVHCLQLERSVTCAIVAGGALLGEKLGFATSLANSARIECDTMAFPNPCP